jgi:hypothetical protein
MTPGGANSGPIDISPHAPAPSIALPARSPAGLAGALVVLALLGATPARAQTVDASDTASLNLAIAAVNAGTATTINITGGFTLNAAVTAINTTNTIAITGNNNTINGGGSQRGLFVYAGTVSIGNLAIQNTAAAAAAALVQPPRAASAAITAAQAS